ncbi:MAG: RlmE family RNA methyltransferase [Myxococcales bacterium]|nr:RlmE family RNA methyltransferase [Myxococcales bacterium]
MTYKRPADRYTKKAKAEGFAARSVYKLEEIDRRTKLLRPGIRVLDLGAAPGSWTQYASPKVGSKGKIIAVDLEPLRVKVGPNVEALIMDALGDLSVLDPYGPFDVVMSDMAPHTTGIAFADAARSEELVERVLDVCERLLLPGGTMVAKIFRGEGFEQVRARMRTLFDEVRVIKPEASRRESVEAFLVGVSRKRPPEAPKATAEKAAT